MATATADKPKVQQGTDRRRNRERPRTGSENLKDNPMPDRRRRSRSRGRGEEMPRKRQSSGQVVHRRRSRSVSATPAPTPQSPHPAEIVQRADSSALITLPRFFLLCGYMVGAILVLMCALDLSLAVPFSRASMVFDVGFLISGTILLYLSWDARDGCR